MSDLADRIIAPMKAMTAEAVPEGDDWAHEVKWDGFRLLVTLVGDRVIARSSTGRDLSATAPELAPMGAALRVDAIIDGEFIVPDDEGRPDFAAVQRRLGGASREIPASPGGRRAGTFVAFDLLHLGGRDTLELPWASRREVLERLWSAGPAWTLSPVYDDGAALADQMAQRCMEGVLSKRRDQPYQPGRRSPGWRKVKTRRRQEFVVGGWLPGQGRLGSALGSLLVGYHDGTALRFAGRVGSGIGDDERRRLEGELTATEVGHCPFEPPPPAEVLRRAQWSEPRLVVEVGFSEWTPEGRLRHPSLVGVRTDVDWRRVVREP